MGKKKKFFYNIKPFLYIKKKKKKNVCK